ncbi:MAG: transcriptional repressor [Thermoguttaceae bacterium]|nr:transcriptional repressor [Thermoguttaceae bacterium]MDW8078463.1 transcriptional repressor [Thermoguttaceae bacterium]
MDKPDRIDEFKELCRRRGIPMTPQRRAVFEAILARGDHPTADQVFEEVHKRLADVSKATVYRVLERLVEAGLVRRVVHSGMPARFDADLTRHHHATCRRCGRILDVRDPKLDAIDIPSELQEHFEVEDFCVQFFGLCFECRSQAGEQPDLTTSA